MWNMIPQKITNIKNPKSFQEAIMELPFTTPRSSPKLPLKHTAQRKLIHGVGMETVYVCMWQFKAATVSLHITNLFKMFV